MLHEVGEVKGVGGLAKNVADQGRGKQLFNAVQNRLGDFIFSPLWPWFKLARPVVVHHGVSDVILHHFKAVVFVGQHG